MQLQTMLSSYCVLLCAVVITLSTCFYQVEGSGKKYRDCHERWKEGEMKSGLYDIHLNSSYVTKIFCNFTSKAAYTIIQQRVDNSVSFYRGWRDYQNGFGNYNTNFWIGLETIYHLTNAGNNVLRVDLHDWYGNQRFITYSYFHVADYNDRYRMYVSGGYGNVPDDLSYQSGMQFFTYDYPDVNNCAVNQRAGWWYNYCAYTLPNGIYYNGGPYNPSSKGFYDGIYWKDWLGFGYSLKFIRMTLYRN